METSVWMSITALIWTMWTTLHICYTTYTHTYIRICTYVTTIPCKNSDYSTWIIEKPKLTTFHMKYAVQLTLLYPWACGVLWYPTKGHMVQYSLQVRV